MAVPLPSIRERTDRAESRDRPQDRGFVDLARRQHLAETSTRGLKGSCCYHKHAPQRLNPHGFGRPHGPPDGPSHESRNFPPPLDGLLSGFVDVCIRNGPAQVNVEILDVVEHEGWHPIGKVRTHIEEIRALNIV